MLDAGIGWLWDTMGWQRTNAEAFEQLLGAAISPIGAVLIGVTAGLGEEMVVRGALQPRLGLLLSNLFFTSLHAFQYGFDALLSVFVVGLVLGVVRARSNTTTSSIVHGLYDFILVMISALALFG
jgi:membrane protease YdiL (CAAX protease family)